MSFVNRIIQRITTSIAAFYREKFAAPLFEHFSKEHQETLAARVALAKHFADAELTAELTKLRSELAAVRSELAAEIAAFKKEVADEAAHVANEIGFLHVVKRNAGNVIGSRPTREPRA